MYGYEQTQGVFPTMDQRQFIGLGYGTPYMPLTYGGFSPYGYMGYWPGYWHHGFHGHGHMPNHHHGGHHFHGMHGGHHMHGGHGHGGHGHGHHMHGGGHHGGHMHHHGVPK